MGKIAIEGMRFHAFHGCFEEEWIIGGEYVVDVYLQTNFEKATDKDEIGNTINYEEVYILVKKEMNRKAKLIETVAQNILNALNKSFKTEKIKVRVSKLNPPLPGFVDRTFVEVEK